MFEHPYFLAIAICSLLFLLFRQPRYFLKHAYLRSVKSGGSSSFWKRAQQFCNIFGWLLLVIAAGDLTIGTKAIVKKRSVHKYILTNDASGSMVAHGRKRGIGPELAAVEEGNKALLEFLSNRADDSKDFVGATVFDHETYVVSHLVDDPEFVGKKLSSINYDSPPLGGGTSLDKAIWGGIEVVINGNEELDEKQLTALNTRVFGNGDLVQDDVLLEIVGKCLKNSENASLVIYTDGVFANAEGTSTQMSGLKLLELCKALKIRVYMLSVKSMPVKVLEKIKATGGDGIVVDANSDPHKLASIYKDIVNSQAQEMTIAEEDVKRSFATELGISSAILLLLGFVISQTVNRKYTEV